MRKAVDNSCEEEAPIRICQTAVEFPPIRTAADSSFEVTNCDLKNYANGVKSCERAATPMRNCPTAVKLLPMRSCANIICAHRWRLYAFVKQLRLCAMAGIAVELVVTNPMTKTKGRTYAIRPIYLCAPAVSQP